MHLSSRLIYSNIIVALVVAVVIAATPKFMQAAEFDPNFIISDAEILDSGAMGLADIQQFLESHGSYLAKYRGEDYYGTVRSAAEIIYNAATNGYDCSGVAVDNPQDLAEAKAKCVKTSINPRFLLVLLQKEQSLIDDPSPKASQLDWAMGYGCPDGAACSERWRGFGKQVNAAALQFYDYMVNPRYYHYQAGQSYTILNTNHDPTIVTPANRATAALYNYTPHVYNGNYNFWKLWQKYFTQIYPDGSLLQPEGEEVVYLIQSGHRRPFVSRGALVSRFDPRKIITVKPADLENYPLGAPIKFQQYSLVQAPSGAIYLLVDDKRRGFVSKQAFSKMGFNRQEVVLASWEDLAPYKESTPITVTSTYPTGALLQDKKTGGVYWVEEGRKHPLLDRALLTTKFANRRIIPADATELAAYQTEAPIKLDDGNLIKIEGSPGVYILDHGTKRLIPNERVFEGLGYKWSNIITVNPQHFELYLLGQPVEDRLPVDSGPLIATSTPTTSLSDLVSTSTNNDIGSTSSSTINSFNP